MGQWLSDVCAMFEECCAAVRVAPWSWIAVVSWDECEHLYDEEKIEWVNGSLMSVQCSMYAVLL